MFNSPGGGVLPWDDLRKNFSGCQPMAKVPNATEILLKIWTGWVECTNVTDDRQTRCRAAGSIRISVSHRASCCCSTAIAGNAIGAKLQNLSPPSVLFESSPNFLQYTYAKKWWTSIFKFEFCDFWEFFEIFKKASRGPSAADLDLDHYGRGQTRSE